MKYLLLILLSVHCLLSCHSSKREEDLAQTIEGTYKVSQGTLDGKRLLRNDSYKDVSLAQVGSIKVMKLDNAFVGIQIVLPGQPDPYRIKYNFFGKLKKEDQVSRGIIIYDSETKEEVGIYKNKTLGLNLYSNTVFKNVVLLAKK